MKESFQSLLSLILFKFPPGISRCKEHSKTLQGWRQVKVRVIKQPVPRPKTNREAPGVTSCTNSPRHPVKWDWFLPGWRIECTTTFRFESKIWSIFFIAVLIPKMKRLLFYLIWIPVDLSSWPWCCFSYFRYHFYQYLFKKECTQCNQIIFNLFKELVFNF